MWLGKWKKSIFLFMFVIFLLVVRRAAASKQGLEANPRRTYNPSEWVISQTYTHHAGIPPPSLPPQSCQRSCQHSPVLQASLISIQNKKHYGNRRQEKFEVSVIIWLSVGWHLTGGAHPHTPWYIGLRVSSPQIEVMWSGVNRGDQHRLTLIDKIWLEKIKYKSFKNHAVLTYTSFYRLRKATVKVR